MTPNPAIQPSFSSEHRNATRSAGARWKAGAAPSLIPLRPIEVGGNPKVHLDGISLSYKTNDGKQATRARQHRSESSARRVLVHRWPFRLRKVNPASLDSWPA